MDDFVRDPKAYDVVLASCTEQGLPQPNGIVIGSDDVTLQQMMSTLSRLGLDLVQTYVWPRMEKAVDLTIPTPLPTDQSILIDMPSDFDRWVDDTGWNTSARWPLMGPANPQSWQTFTQFLGNGTMFRVMWRSAGESQMEVKPLNAGQNISLRYVSRGWVRDATDSVVFRDHVEKDADRCLFDFQLLLLGLIYKWRERKGFETTNEKRDYEYRRDKLLGDQRGAPTLNLSHRRIGAPLISSANLPDTGFGQ